MSAHSFSFSDNNSSSTSAHTNFLEQAALALVKNEAESSSQNNQSKSSYSSDFLINAKLAEMDNNSAIRLNAIEAKTNQRFANLEDKLAKIAVLLEKQHTEHPEHFDTPQGSPNIRKKPSEPMTEDEETITDRFIPFASKWRLYTPNQLIQKLKGYHERSILDEDKEAAEFLFSVTSNYKVKGIDNTDNPNI